MRAALRLLAIASNLLSAHQPALDPCRPFQDRLKAATSAVEPIDRFRQMVRFLDSVPDDPEDCVRGQAQREIAAIEKSLMWLEAAGRTRHPDVVLHCNEIGPATKECAGPVLDTSLMLPESELAARLDLPAFRPPRARIRFAKGTEATVVGAFAGMTFKLQNGSVPLPVPRQGSSLDLRSLEKAAGLVLIVILRRSDSLGLRKVVWHL